LGVLGVPANAALAEAASPSQPTATRIELVADRDDDDRDGQPDGEQPWLPPLARADLVTIEPRFAGASFQVLSGAEHARLVRPSGEPVAWSREPTSARWFQGLSPGRVELLATAHGEQSHVTLVIKGIDLRDGEGHLVDMARSQASLERSPPTRVDGPSDALYDDFDALRVVLTLPDEGPGLDGDRELAVDSVTSAGVRIDDLVALALAPTSCPRAYEGVRCWASAPLRFVVDDVDRNHPLVVGRSIKAQVGGAIVFRADPHKAQMVRVLGPRSSPVGPIGRSRASLRPFVLRVVPGGAPAVGVTDALAIEALRSELASAAAIWGQCGVTFGDLQKLQVKVVDPPPPHLIAVGDDLGIAATGGEVRLRVDGKAIVVATEARELPDRVARDIAHAVDRAGLVAWLSENARISPALGPSVDVSVRHKDGTLASVESLDKATPSNDPTLSVRIGSVDLADGLQHFTDINAVAGTLEERTLTKALDDGDPSTVEVIVVPLFAGGGRIGESFIGSDGSSVRNVVLLDRAGIRARNSSLTLAHELGHVLMDLPGHPDDYSIDTPTLLMDSDAADASPFGPRRIPVDQCARMVRQAGPNARVPILSDWPIAPIPMGRIKP
jgi:hypothetical protein